MRSPPRSSLLAFRLVLLVSVCTHIFFLVKLVCSKFANLILAMSSGPERPWDPTWGDPQDQRVDWDAVARRVPFQRDPMQGRVPWQGSSWQDGSSSQSQPGWQPKGKPTGKSKGEPKGDPKGEPKGDPKGAPKGDSKFGPKGQPKGQPRWDDQAAWASWASPEHEHNSPVWDSQESQAAQHGFKGGQSESLLSLMPHMNMQVCSWIFRLLIGVQKITDQMVIDYHSLPFFKLDKN